MKVKVLCRNPDTYLRETKRDIYKVPRNYDPSLHPFEAPREYTKALNAVKLDRVFAKPFIGNLDGHREGLACFGKHPKKLSTLTSGCYDGELRMWDLPQQKCIRRFQAHDGMIRGIEYHPDGLHFITVGNDQTIKTWDSECPDSGELTVPVNTIISKTIVTGVSHHRSDAKFATCGDKCQIWDESRNEPISSFEWGVDTLHDVKYNPVQTNILASCASDRSIILYDTRDSGPLRKVIMALRTNKLCWNPMEAFIFTCASDDFNLYTFDTRQLKLPVNVHKNHTSAVIDLDYSPTGKEFVSGSFDKTIRIYQVHKTNSRDIYHTKRMQRLTCVLWSLDDKYILSGSDEMNIRVWKARSSEKLGVLKPREKAALNYSEALKEKFASHPQVRRIAGHRQVPKHIMNGQMEMRAISEKAKRKFANKTQNSKPGSVPFVTDRMKPIVAERE